MNLDFEKDTIVEERRNKLFVDVNYKARRLVMKQKKSRMEITAFCSDFFFWRWVAYNKFLGQKERAKLHAQKRRQASPEWKEFRVHISEEKCESTLPKKGDVDSMYLGTMYQSARHVRQTVII